MSSMEMSIALPIFLETPTRLAFSQTVRADILTPLAAVILSAMASGVRSRSMAGMLSLSCCIALLLW